MTERSEQRFPPSKVAGIALGGLILVEAAAIEFHRRGMRATLEEAGLELSSLQHLALDGPLPPIALVAAVVVMGLSLAIRPSTPVREFFAPGVGCVIAFLVLATYVFGFITAMLAIGEV